ncbi:MAG: hypothetical protein IPN62_01435 [Flavobacteriales bacterium]|nr:hypothetical protein [Flavobacteriales bacterium]
MTTSLIRSSLFCILSLSTGATLVSQTNPFGCHYFRNGHRPHPEATAADRTQIAETIARSDTFDILHYDITLDVTNYGGASITGATTIDVRALVSDVDHIRFDLFELTVDSVLSDGSSLTHAYDGQFLDVDLPTPMAQGEEIAITVHYHGQPHRDPDWGLLLREPVYLQPGHRHQYNTTQLRQGVVSLFRQFRGAGLLFLPRQERRHLPLPWPGEFLG